MKKVIKSSPVLMFALSALAGCNGGKDKNLVS